MKIVTRTQFDAVVQSLASELELALDCETYGLRWFQGDRLFSIILASASEEYYFNFHAYPEIPASDERVLPREWIPRMQPIFSGDATLYAHNAKFDWHMVENEGLVVGNPVWCTEAQARVEYNEHLKYSLDACLKRIGLGKDDAVKKWLDDNKAWEWRSYPGKKTRSKIYHYDRAPFDLIVPYGCSDARGCFTLAQTQRKRFTELDSSSVGAPAIWNVARNEMGFTRVAQNMEREGIKIDRKYCEEARDYEQARALEAEAEFHRLTGTELVDSNVGLAVLKTFGVKPGLTEGGKDSFDYDSLAPYKALAPVACVITHRDACKRGNTYFGSYLDLADRHDRIHLNLRQAGTGTGRTSASDPNLQNVPVHGDDESPYPVRRGFVPDEGGFLASIDWKQLEYYLLLDYSGEQEVINQVLQGLDLHTATAIMMGLGPEGRQTAKTINFALLYGAGAAKLAAMLGISLEKAMELRARYFAALTRVRALARGVTKTAETRGYIWNWFGRRCYFPNPTFAYKAPNYLIQGGCGDIKKIWLVNTFQKVLPGRKSKLLLEVHDEGLFWIHESERAIISDIVHEAKSAYPHKRLPLDCSVSTSYKSWYDLEDYVV